MSWQQFRDVVVVILSVGLLNSILFYAAEPGGAFIRFCHIALVESIRLCLWVADCLQRMGEYFFRAWLEQPQNRWPNVAQPPRYLVYGVKAAEFGANLLRYLGNFLARGAISYRNDGGVHGPWPARFVITARDLFLPDSVQKLSFTTTWATDVRG